MITRVFSAGLRALLMAWMVVMPAVMLPGVGQDATQIFMFASLIAAALTFIEYVSSSPSLIEFRSAAPFNRVRFTALFLTLFVLSLVVQQSMAPSRLGGAVTAIGAQVGAAMDFPFSPVRLAVLIAPETAPPEFIALLRSLAGLAYAIGLATLAIFVPLVRLMNWPIRKAAFNVWVNLPQFDPTAGGDVIYRLKRDANFNVALGFLLPFLIPGLLKLGIALGAALPLADPLTLVWTMTIWGFLPTSLIMRGVALLRIADLIEEKRRRAYAQSDVLQLA